MNGRGPRGGAGAPEAAAGGAERRAAEIAARKTGGAGARRSDAPVVDPVPEGAARGGAMTGAGKTALSLRIAATPPGVRAGLARVMRHPLLLALGAEARAEAELVLAEVMNNIVEHACSPAAGEDPALPQNCGSAVATSGGGPGARDREEGAKSEGAVQGRIAGRPERRGAGDEAPAPQIRLRILRVDAEGQVGLAFRLFDPGRPMPGGLLPEGAPVPAEALAEGGFGWFMIRSLVQDLHYSRARGGNLLAFSMKWKQS